MVISAHRTAGVVAVLALSLLALSLAACGSTDLPGPAASGHALPSRPPVGRGTGGAGSITVSVAKPVVVSGHVDTTVTCATASRTYTASGDGALVAGYHVAFSVKVVPYHGPDDYPAAIVSVKLDGPSGTVESGSVPAPVTVTRTGGSFQIDTTAEGGRAFAASLDWACS
jgi:hypothetical protein